jgi:hypothetical protein
MNEVVYEDAWRPPVVVNYKKPTFKKFLTTEQLEDISKNAGTMAAWDFNTALGDTIKEKYESLYVKCIELTNVLLKKGAAGYFWIATSPEVSSIFETATYGFAPHVYLDEWEGDRISSNLDVWPMGGSDNIQYCGSINMKWRLYKDTRMPVDMVVIGCNDEVESYNHYAVLRIANFII